MPFSIKISSEFLKRKKQWIEQKSEDRFEPYDFSAKNYWRNNAALVLFIGFHDKNLYKILQGNMIDIDTFEFTNSSFTRNGHRYLWNRNG